MVLFSLQQEKEAMRLIFSVLKRSINSQSASGIQRQSIARIFRIQSERRYLAVQMVYYSFIIMLQELTQRCQR